MDVFDVIIVMLFVSGISMAGLGLFARRFIGRVPAAIPFILLMFGAAAWSVLYALDLLETILPLKVFYHNLRFLFLPYFPVLELWLVVAYVRRTEWLRRDVTALVMVIPVTASVLALTSPYHELFRYNFTINSAGPIPVLQYSESTFFLVYNAYSFILLLAACLLLISETRRQAIFWQNQTVLILCALAIPTIINYTSMIGLTPAAGVNMAPVLMWVPAILYTIALFRYRFLDIVPIARDRLVDALSKPVLVLDTDERIIDLNPAACTLFTIPRASALGMPVAEVAQDWPEFLDLCRERTAQKRGLRWARHDGIHYFIGTAEPLLTAGGEIEGHLIFLHDVTELKMAEEALRMKTEELDQYFNTSLDLFCIADTQGYFRRLNPEWEKTLGYTLADLEGRRFLDFVHPDDLPVTLAAIADLSAQKEVLNFTNRYRHRDGTYRWIEWRSFPKGDRIFAAARDITDRKHMEEALRESEEKYRAIINGMQDIFYRTDMAGKITMLSPSAAKLAGYSSLDQLLGRDVTSVYADPSDRDKLLAVLEESGSVYAFPLDLRVRDGSIRHVTTSSHFYRDPQGNILGVEGVIHDITNLRRAEDALRESEERYRTIIENIQDVYFRIDGKNRIVMVSPSGAQTFGYPSATEMLGLPVQSLWRNPELRSPFLDAMEKQGGAVQDWEAEFVKRDGTIFWVSISAHLRKDTRGNYRGTEGIIRDISERKKMEEALKSALKKLNMLSSITRHDILNQITGLRTYLELSREDLKGTPFAAFIEKEDEVAEAIQRQIEFTRYYQDIGVNTAKWQDVSTIISDAAGQLSLAGIGLKADVAKTEIYADPLIVKVFFNLLENSLRHGGGVTQMSFSSRETDAGLVITYRDNGTGISLEDKKKLFQKGFGKHTGLGLFLSREILAITGISITENGEPGKGVQFEMTIPAGAYRFLM